MPPSTSAKPEYAPIEVREIPLSATTGKVRFTKALIEVNPPCPLAVVHYSFNGQPREDGIAIDLDKGIFLDACKDADVSKMAASVRTQILKGLRG